MSQEGKLYLKMSLTWLKFFLRLAGCLPARKRCFLIICHTSPHLKPTQYLSGWPKNTRYWNVHRCFWRKTLICTLIISLRSTRVNTIDQISFLKSCHCLWSGLITVPLFLWIPPKTVIPEETFWGTLSWSNIVLFLSTPSRLFLL